MSSTARRRDPAIDDQGKLQSITNTQLFEDCTNVCFHRPVGDAEFACDFLVARPAAQCCGDFALALSQTVAPPAPVLSRRRWRGRKARSGYQQPLHEVLADPQATLQHDRRHLLKRLRERVGVAVAARTGREGSERFFVARQIAHHDDRKALDRVRKRLQRRGSRTFMRKPDPDQLRRRATQAHRTQFCGLCRRKRFKPTRQYLALFAEEEVCTRLVRHVLPLSLRERSLLGLQHRLEQIG